jgi:pimeloyl-ACP methyl ester carboxylesterase
MSPTSGPAAPTQSATGPGSEERAVFQKVVAHHYGDKDYGYWIFEPADPINRTATPAARTALPVVLFLSGCCGDPPLSDSCPVECHTDWIPHLVRQGEILIYPIFTPKDADAHIADAMRGALAELQRGDHAKPDLQRFALFGWSFGGMLAANYLATAAAAGLPEPQAVMLFAPGCGDACTLADLSTVPATTRFLLIVSTADTMETNEDQPKTIWAQLSQIPAAQRDYIRIGADDHASPPPDADHTAPASGIDWATLDLIDWYGFWKPFDALMACTFAGKWCEFAFGDTPEQRFMGIWGDGVPVKEAVVTVDPGPPA